MPAYSARLVFLSLITLASLDPAPEPPLDKSAGNLPLVRKVTKLPFSKAALVNCDFVPSVRVSVPVAVGAAAGSILICQLLSLSLTTRECLVAKFKSAILFLSANDVLRFPRSNLCEITQPVPGLKLKPL